MQARSYDELIEKMAGRMFYAWLNRQCAEEATDEAKESYYLEIADEYNKLWHEMERAIRFCFELEEDRSPFCDALDLAGARWDEYIQTNMIFS